MGAVDEWNLDILYTTSFSTYYPLPRKEMGRKCKCTPPYCRKRWMLKWRLWSKAANKSKTRRGKAGEVSKFEMFGFLMSKTHSLFHTLERTWDTDWNMLWQGESNSSSPSIIFPSAQARDIRMCDLAPGENTNNNNTTNTTNTWLAKKKWTPRENKRIGMRRLCHIHYIVYPLYSIYHCYWLGLAKRHWAVYNYF